MALQRVFPLSSLLLRPPSSTTPSPVAVAACLHRSHQALGIRTGGKRWVSSFNSSHRGTFTSPRNRYRQPTFLASGAKEAQEALAHLRKIYGDPGLEHADVIVALGKTRREKGRDAWINKQMALPLPLSFSHTLSLSTSLSLSRFRTSMRERERERERRGGKERTERLSYTVSIVSLGGACLELLLLAQISISLCFASLSLLCFCILR
jgi:hypothetical protein